MAYISIFVVLSISAILMGNGESGVNFEIVPAIIAISALLSWPIADWLKRRRDTFDPICLLAIFGTHFYLLGPQYQLANSFFPYLSWNESLQSYAPVWFYTQAVFLAVALVAAHVQLPVARQWSTSPEMNSSSERISLDSRHALVAVFITFIMKLATFYYFGGVAGVVGAYETRLTYGVIENNPFAGLGPLVLLGDMFPIALGIFVVAKWKNSYWFKSDAGLVAFLVVLLIIALVSVGLRGSRSSVVFAMAIVLLTYHYMVRPLTKMHLLAGVAALVVFMQAYLVYKFGGIDAVFSDQARQQSFSARNLDEGPEFVLIRDFTRMDVQTIAMYQVAVGEYPLAWGRSLLSGLTAVIPSFIFPARLPTFILEKSEILSPGRSFDPRQATTLVFGGFGEVFVNFGWASLLLAWPFGRLLQRLRAVTARARHKDASAILAPISTLLPIALLIYDSNSLAYFVIQFCTVSVYLWWQTRRKEKRHVRQSSHGARSLQKRA